MAQILIGKGIQIHDNESVAQVSRARFPHPSVVNPEFIEEVIG
jgi:hypothetical protein